LHDLRVLIEQLDSLDPAVRTVAIERLRSMTGESFGFEPHASVEERSRAIRAWVEWLERSAPEKESPGGGEAAS